MMNREMIRAEVFIRPVLGFGLPRVAEAMLTRARRARGMRGDERVIRICRLATR